MVEREFDARSRKGSRQIRRAELWAEAIQVLRQVAAFLARTYPGGPPPGYTRALINMAEDDVVRHKAAWLLEQRSRFPAVQIILGCLHIAAACVAEGRVALKPREVEEQRRVLLEAAAFARAEAGAAAVGFPERALELEADAADWEAAVASSYGECPNPAIVTYRSCDRESAEALALGTLRTLRHGLATVCATPMAGVAAAFAAAAVGVPVTRDQARLFDRPGPPRRG